MNAPRQKLAIGQSFRRLSVATILALGAILGSLFVVTQYWTLQEQNREEENEYYEEHRNLLRSETDRFMEKMESAVTRSVLDSQPVSRVQDAVRKTVPAERFQTNGNFFILDPSGVMIAHPRPPLIGRTADNIRDAGGASLGNEFVVLSRDPDGGFLEFFRQDAPDMRPVLRMAYVRVFRPWNWIIGAEIPIEQIRDLIRANKLRLSENIAWRIALIVLITAVLVALSAAGADAIARRLQNEMGEFIRFFRALSRSHREMDAEPFAFSETAELARTANAMNREIRTKTQKLRKEIREREQAQEELLKLSQAVEQSPAIVVITDKSGIIEYINPKFTETTGYMPSEAIGRKTNILRSGFQPDGFYRDFWKSIAQGGNWKGEFHNRKKNGELYWESALVTGIRNARGQVTHYLKVADDISERKRLEQNMEYLAHHDTLTGLPNRLLFSDRVHHAIAHAHRNRRSFAVMILDLDNFKTVNDTLGHEAGDELLKMTVKRFVRFLREEDTASRMGGDEFNLLVNDLTSLDALNTVAGRIVESFREPFPLKGKRVIVTPSIGIAVYPQDGKNLEDLVKNADIALYRVKNAGKNGYQLFSRSYAPLTSPVSGNGKET